MLYGAVFPQTEIGSDRVAIRDYAQAVEGLGFNHLLAYDHVIGASTVERPDWRGPYTAESQFHEPFVLFAYLAGLTQRIEFVTGVIILPQRQTVLVAKQAAALDVLSGGRLRLGVGIGWNPVEFEALGEDFNNRGKRSEEQITLLRQLFHDPVVTFAGQWHRVSAAGLNPLPVRRHIPIWLGGSVEATLDRVARLGDGWFPQMRPESDGRAMVEKLRTLAVAAGRDPATVGVEARVAWRANAQDQLLANARAWRDIGATHLTVNTMGAHLATPGAHIAALTQAKALLDGL